MWKARILIRKGDKAGAIATAQEGIKLAEAGNTPEYVRLNSEVIAKAKE